MAPCVESVQNEAPDFRPDNHSAANVVSRSGRDLLLQVARSVVNDASYLRARLGNCRKKLNLTRRISAQERFKETENVAEVRMGRRQDSAGSVLWQFARPHLRVQHVMICLGRPQARFFIFLRLF